MFLNNSSKLLLKPGVLVLYTYRAERLFTLKTRDNVKFPITAEERHFVQSLEIKTSFQHVARW